MSDSREPKWAQSATKDNTSHQKHKRKYLFLTDSNALNECCPRLKLVCANYATNVSRASKMHYLVSISWNNAPFSSLPFLLPPLLIACSILFLVWSSLPFFDAMRHITLKISKKFWSPFSHHESELHFTTRWCMTISWALFSALYSLLRRKIEWDEVSLIKQPFFTRFRSKASSFYIYTTYNITLSHSLTGNKPGLLITKTPTEQRF